MANKVHIFSNGSEYDYWRHRNCEQCKKSTDNDPAIGPADVPLCSIEYDVMFASISDGMVSPETLQKTGVGNGGKCIELELVNETV